MLRVIRMISVMLKSCLDMSTAPPDPLMASAAQGRQSRLPPPTFPLSPRRFLCDFRWKQLELYQAHPQLRDWRRSFMPEEQKEGATRPPSAPGGGAQPPRPENEPLEEDGDDTAREPSEQGRCRGDEVSPIGPSSPLRSPLDVEEGSGMKGLGQRRKSSRTSVTSKSAAYHYGSKAMNGLPAVTSAKTMYQGRGCGGGGEGPGAEEEEEQPHFRHQ